MKVATHTPVQNLRKLPPPTPLDPEAKENVPVTIDAFQLTGTITCGGLGMVAGFSTIPLFARSGDCIPSLQALAGGLAAPIVGGIAGAALGYYLLSPSKSR